MKKTIVLRIATLGFLGFLPAPGTVGTIAVLPLVYFFSKASCFTQLSFILLLVVSGFVIIRSVIKELGQTSDPSYIILDEVIGCCITFFCISFSWPVMILGVVLFRFFDIVKPLGIKRLERYLGAWGIIMDDIAAGIMSNVFLYVIWQYFFL
jgi:phosphatidylglycerophosphatase A